MGIRMLDDEDDIEIPGVGSASTRRRRRRVLALLAALAAGGAIALAVKVRSIGAVTPPPALSYEPNVSGARSPPPTRPVDIPEPPEADETPKVANIPTAVFSAPVTSAAPTTGGPASAEPAVAPAHAPIAQPRRTTTPTRSRGAPIPAKSPDTAAPTHAHSGGAGIVRDTPF